MKGTKLGDKLLTVTPRTPKGKAKQQENSSGENLCKIIIIITTCFLN